MGAFGGSWLGPGLDGNTGAGRGSRCNGWGWGWEAGCLGHAQATPRASTEVSVRAWVLSEGQRNPGQGRWKRGGGRRGSCPGRDRAVPSWLLTRPSSRPPGLHRGHKPLGFPPPLRAELRLLEDLVPGPAGVTSRRQRPLPYCPPSLCEAGTGHSPRFKPHLCPACYSQLLGSSPSPSEWDHWRRPKMVMSEWSGADQVL